LQDIYAGQVRLLGMFIHFQKVSVDRAEYSVAMLNNLNTLTWLLKTKHPCGKILMKDPMMMNEELGELTFSVLSRGQNSNPNRQDVKHVSKSYRKTRAQMQLAAELGVDLNSTDLAGGKGNTIKADSIADATNFFLGMLRDFKAGAWLSSSKPTQKVWTS
jgi:hypothetical protein